MNRTTFETNRALEFFSEKELSIQIGSHRHRWPISIIKELIDNSLDACEAAGILPEIHIDIGEDYFSVADNGPGLPADTLRRSLDYMIRVSDKNHYVSPSRGQLGNALKCVWAAPFVASKNGCSRVEVGTNGKRYDINVQVDAIRQEPAITLSDVEDPLVKNGTFLKIHSPELAWLLNEEPRPYFYNPQEHLYDMVDGYMLFNPAAEFTLTIDGKRYVYPRTSGGIEKWTPADPTSIWWYDAARFENLICAYLADEERGGRPKPIREFIAEFNGLKSTGKHKRILNEIGLTGAHLNALVNGNGLHSEVCEDLLFKMRQESKPIKPVALGVVGSSLERWPGIKSIKYRKRTGTVADLPYVLEVSFGTKETESVMTYTGLNFSQTLTNPFENLDRYLGHAMIDSDDPVVLFIYLSMPVLNFTDRGKSRLSLPGEIEKDLADAIGYATKEWTQFKKRKKREDKASCREWEEQERRKRRKAYSIRDAAFEVMESAYMDTSDNGTLPAHARQIMYTARPGVIELAGKTWKHSSYFTQTLLNDYVDQNPETTADWDVVFDARGRLMEPHTGRTIDIGTLSVRGYVFSWKNGSAFMAGERTEPGAETSGPACRYKYALFVEKEGFNTLFERAQIAERYDMAIMSTKGMSTTSARALVEALTLRGVTILVIRDFDKAGFSIVHTLMNDTGRYQYSTPPNVIDLGLRLEDVNQWGLPSEEVHYNSNVDPRVNIIASGATEAEADFLVRGGYPKRWRGERVELNAFKSRELLDWLEGKLKSIGVAKMIPGEKEISTAYTEFYRQHMINQKIREFAEALERQEINLPDNLRGQLQRAITGTGKAWDQAVSELAQKNLNNLLQKRR